MVRTYSGSYNVNLRSIVSMVVTFSQAIPIPDDDRFFLRRYRSSVGFNFPLELRVVTVWGKAWRQDGVFEDGGILDIP